MRTGKIVALVLSIVIGCIAIIFFFSSQSAVTECGNAFVAAMASSSCNQDTAIHDAAAAVFAASLFIGIYVVATRDR